MVSDVQRLVGTFVIEVGERQAWPFLTFCDNGPTPPLETRLYIDSDWSVSRADGLPGLMMLGVSEVAVDGAALTIKFDEGPTLYISGVPNANTTGDVWWLGSA